jgi:hypothetical protein
MNPKGNVCKTKNGNALDDDKKMLDAVGKYKKMGVLNMVRF